MSSLAPGYCCYFDVISGATSHPAGPLGFDLAIAFFVELESKSDPVVTTARRIVGFDGSHGQHFLIGRDRQTKVIHIHESGVLTRATAHWWWCRTAAHRRSPDRTYAVATNDLVAWMRDRIAREPDVERAQLIVELLRGEHVGRSELEDVLVKLRGAS